MKQAEQFKRFRALINQIENQKLNSACKDYKPGTEKPSKANNKKERK